MRPGRVPPGAEALPRAALRERAYRVRAVAAGSAGDHRRVDRGTDWRVLPRRVPDHPGGGGELGVGEEAGLPAAYGQPQLIADVAVVVEEEQPDAVQLGVVVDVDLVPQRLARYRRHAGEGQVAAA